MQMQIFLPDPDIIKTCKLLDSVTLLRNFYTCGYLYHNLRSANISKNPLYELWYGRISDLVRTKDCFGIELIKWRGFPDTINNRFPTMSCWGNYPSAGFLSIPAFYKLHQAALLSMNYIYYSRYRWDVPEIKVDFWWP